VTYYGQIDGGYQCRAGKTMLMVCIIGIVLALPTSIAMPTDSHWPSGSRATVMVNRTGQTEHTIIRMVEVMHVAGESYGSPREHLP
jgi:hypothetical protein